MFSIVYSSNLQARLIKLLKCKRCKKEYVYPIMIHALGTGGAFLAIGLESAKAESKREVEAVFDRKVRLCNGRVACPTCGSYAKFGQYDL